MTQLDTLFIHPNAAQKTYQDLSGHYAAIEPPIRAGMLAHHCLKRGFLGIAVKEKRLVRTMDKEFGDLVFD